MCKRFYYKKYFRQSLFSDNSTWPAKMVIMLRQCCCGCSLKTGTIIIGVLNIVSANFPSNLLTVYRNGSAFSQEQTAFKLKKLQFNCVDKLFDNKHSNHVRTVDSNTWTLLKVRDRKHEYQKRIILYFCIHQIRCEKGFGACGRLKYSCSARHITESKGDWNYNKSACILK